MMNTLDDETDLMLCYQVQIDLYFQKCLKICDVLGVVDVLITSLFSDSGQCCTFIK